MLRPLTSLEYALLGLVQQGPISGYELCKVFETTPMGHYSSSPGSIYPALKRLEKRGLLSGVVERAQSMRPRRIFETTSDGQQELIDWMSAAVTQDDVVWNEDGLLLRFGFMGNLVGKETVCRFLEQLVGEVETLVTGLQAHHRSMQGIEEKASALPTGRLALGYGIESYRGLAKWARRSLKELAEAE